MSTETYDSLYWRNNNRCWNRYWVDNFDCYLYYQTFPHYAGEVFNGYDLRNFEVVYVPVEYGDAVTKNTLEDIDEDERQKYDRFVNDHTFYFDASDMFEEWLEDYKKGEEKVFEYYMSKYTDKGIRSAPSRCPCSVYSILFQYHYEQFMAFRKYMKEKV